MVASFLADRAAALSAIEVGRVVKVLVSDAAHDTDTLLTSGHFSALVPDNAGPLK